MIKLISFVTLFISISTYCQVSSCPNSNFETGTFTGWKGSIGKCCPITTNPSVIISGRHTIMSGNGKDPNTCNNISVVAPGEVYSARLGNDDVGAEAEKLSYTITVSQSNSLFIYKYAVVLQDPDHDESQQPRFEIKVLNASGNLIDPICGKYSVVASGDIPGFKTCSNSKGDIRYKDWTTVGLDLSSYIGQTITIEFATGDCSLGGHFGYAYIDAFCSPLQINSTFCAGAVNTVLTAPSGFKYLWNTGATTQSINVVNPNQGQTYTCLLTSVTGCTVSLSSVISIVQPTASFTIANTCYSNAIFKNTTIVPSGITLNKYLWDFGDGTTSSLENPVHSYSSPGIFDVTFTISNTLGCTSSTSNKTTVYQEPTAVLAYAGTPFCSLITNSQPVTLTGTNLFEGGIFSATTGLTIDKNTGSIIPSSSIPGTYIVTYTMPAKNGCAPLPVTTTITITALPTATISYSNSPFCSSLLSSQLVTLKGTGAYAGGTFNSTSGLTIDNTTGSILPSTSLAGVYTVTYTIPSKGGCEAQNSTTTVVITPLPTGSITYSNSSFCTSETSPQLITLLGSGAYTGGLYSSSTGLAINKTTGSIVPSASVPGTYTVTYTIPTANGCPSFPVTTIVKIALLPTATISYSNSPFCSSLFSSQLVTLKGTGAYAGGTFNSTSGLTIDKTTGNILPSTSIPGIYTVTYTIPAADGCMVQKSTTTVIITPLPTAAIAYNNSPFCSSDNSSQIITLVGSGAYLGGSYSSTSGLTLNSSTGSIIPSTSTPGTYTVTYTMLSGNGCAPLPVTTIVKITLLPTATIKYNNTTYCNSEPLSQMVSITGTGAFLGGIYSSSSGLMIDPNLGTIMPLASSPGTYTVNYTIPTIDSCIPNKVKTVVTIYPLPNPNLVDGENCLDAAGNLVRIFILDSSLSSNKYSFEWFLNGILISGANLSTLEALKEGNYSVVATNKITGCVSNQVFSTVKNIQMAADFYQSVSDNFSEKNVLTIVVKGGTGPFLYQVDNGVFETYNVFSNLSPGVHVITVTDYNSCTSLSKKIAIMDYPKYFTPNEDGIHDYWNIYYWEGIYNLKTSIFDRYGKLVKQLNPQDFGWDGTYQGKPLPSTDYWFASEYEEYNLAGVKETRVFRSHFTLKR